MDTGVHQAVSAAVRDHRGRLLAALARRSGDLAGAQDALADAVVIALEQWPRQGVPDHPDAWLLTVARNRVREHQRHDGTRLSLQPQLAGVIESLLEQAQAPQPVVLDDRLHLMFVCAHPAIDPRVRGALMLQTVLGVEVARMASAFLLSPVTLAQRLVRAKAKIRVAGIGFELPEASELPSRTQDVIEAIYGAYTRSRQVSDETCAEADALGDEALRLAEVLLDLLPDDPEVMGLVALLNYCESRRDARFDAQGRFVPLAEQDVRRWDLGLVGRAESLLRKAAVKARPGAMQLEAAIQSAHCARRAEGRTPWAMIAALYAALNQHWPSVGATVGHAVAITECGQPLDALVLLERIENSVVKSYLPYWAALGHVLAAAGQTSRSRSAFAHAAGLAAQVAVREHLLARANVDCASSPEESALQRA